MVDRYRSPPITCKTSEKPQRGCVRLRKKIVAPQLKEALTLASAVVEGFSGYCRSLKDYQPTVDIRA